MFTQDFRKDEYILIRTLEGVMKAKVGDYIIKGVHGEFYPCKPDTFHDTYEDSDVPLEENDTKKGTIIRTIINEKT